MSSPHCQSILILGATGRTGLACLRELASLQQHAPQVHAFCRDPSKLNSKDTSLVASVVQGDARSAQDLEHALRESKADCVIVAVGNGDSVAKSDTRAANAKALVQALESQPEFSHVRVLVISSTGAGPSQIKVGLGIGKVIEHHLRHVLKDHTEQETAFHAMSDRVTIVRPTALTEDAPTGHVVEFGDKTKSPTIKTDRADLAIWVVNEILSGKHVGDTVNVTSAKKNKQ